MTPKPQPVERLEKRLARVAREHGLDQERLVGSHLKTEFSELLPEGNIISTQRVPIRQSSVRRDNVGSHKAEIEKGLAV